VHHDDLAVPGELHVELDHLGAELDGAAEGGQRVLGARPARPTVRDHEERHATGLGRPRSWVKSSRGELTRVDRSSKQRGVPSPSRGWIALRVSAPPELADTVANFLLEEGAAGVVSEDAGLESALPASRLDALDRWLASLA